MRLHGAATSALLLRRLLRRTHWLKAPTPHIYSIPGLSALCRACQRRGDEREQADVASIGKRGGGVL